MDNRVCTEAGRSRGPGPGSKAKLKSGFQVLEVLAIKPAIFRFDELAILAQTLAEATDFQPGKPYWGNARPGVAGAGPVLSGVTCLVKVDKNMNDD